MKKASKVRDSPTRTLSPMGTGFSFGSWCPSIRPRLCRLISSLVLVFLLKMDLPLSETPSDKLLQTSCFQIVLGFLLKCNSKGEYFTFD